jgi:hypothetical protein
VDNIRFMKPAKILMQLVAMLAMADVAFSQTWMPTSAPSQTWTSIASSADGSRLIATGFGYTYFTSTNSGGSWNSNSEPQSDSVDGSWYIAASSADGNTLVAASVASSIWVSTNAGASWMSNNVPSVSAWGAVTLSADGSKLVAAAGGNSHPPGLIYTSTNWGNSWSQTSAPTNVWTSIASSADGTKLVAAAAVPWSGVIYTSIDSGVTWIQANVPSKCWQSVASSADGAKLAAVYLVETNEVPGVYLAGHIYTSADSGATWVSNSVVAGHWESVAMSADGNTLVVGDYPYPDPYVYVSTDFGTTWTSNALSAGYTMYVNASADGGKLFAASLGGLIFTSQSVVAPKLNLASPDGNLTLSWLVPSTDFVMQQSPDLGSWTDVTNMPVLNLTNLQNEVVLSPTAGSGFYRLKTP